MDGHWFAWIGLLGGAPALGGLAAGVGDLGGIIVDLLKDARIVVVGLPMVIAAGAAALAGYRRVAAASGSLHRREEELRRLQNEFVQNVAHELRQPLTLIRGYLQLLVDGQLDEDTAQRLCRLALARTVDLVETVETITTFHEAPQGQVKLRRVDLMELAETAMKMVWQRAFRAGVALRLEGPVKPLAVMADPAWLLVALKQLVDNAVKFSPEGGTVHVRVYSSSGEACVEVADHGVGISPHQVERIFAPFRQADGSATRRFGGVGLGLPIVQEVALAHGGRAWVRSEGMDQGCTATLALPL